ncbi:hypothetical protein JM18_009018 [Phytophthora kernoviae]|uniref:DNA mismatch repair proteins mutS family domain-containing protein n=1 Tax=Phytophthora kernoviae TaxID=325452 RepID=A0A921SA59_9STRA|nr:hypothetical protein JM18_009018 [Phytophthora kernoviae]
MLLFQVGDFYEFFGDDARRAAHLLNLALTRKTKKAQVHALNEMCGFPIGSVDSFVEKLVMHHGVKVAICNQTESASSAKKRGYNALVDRQVVRIVTPGSLVEDTMLTPEENNYLASLFYDEEKWGLAWADLSTGEFVSTTSTSDKLASAILRCSPKEILLPSIHVEASDQQREDIVKAAEEIHAALKDDYASLNSKSGFVRAGYSPELDKWQAILRHDPKSPEKQELQAKYRELLGSTRLRVVFQAEKGYFLDLPHEENAKLLKTDRGRQELEKLTMFQSLKNSVRYRSEELRQMNRELTEAAVEVERVENAIFALLRDRVLIVRGELQSMAHAISQIDIVCSHAQVALDRNFTRPLLDGSRELHIEDGRHAVVEAAHLRGSNSRGMRAFVPNSLHLAAVPIGSCWLLTGPNMGGKSTFLRQNAHLVVLAQMGSFVPAKFVRVGLVDKLFCRVGSADDLAADKSTFMVEMQETSTILTQATSRSLVLMDEVGRGTAVNDGVAIAGAVLESLCTKQTRTLFATHFTVLNELVGETCGGELQPYRMEVLEHQVSGQTKQLVFSHRVVKGLATQSYGINTAALAGCPPTVVARATELLVQLAGDCEDNNGLTQTDEHQQECKEDNEVSNS